MHLLSLFGAVLFSNWGTYVFEMDRFPALLLNVDTLVFAFDYIICYTMRPLKEPPIKIFVLARMVKETNTSLEDWMGWQMNTSTGLKGWVTKSWTSKYKAYSLAWQINRNAKMQEGWSPVRNGTSVGTSWQTNRSGRRHLNGTQADKEVAALLCILLFWIVWNRGNYKLIMVEALGGI